MINISRLEECCACGGLTGRGGKVEDSLYLLKEGPFCEGCYEVRSSYAEIVDVKLRQRVSELEAEVERLRILHNECAQCGAALYDCTEPPHCENCVVGEDERQAWEESVIEVARLKGEIAAVQKCAASVENLRSMTGDAGTALPADPHGTIYIKHKP